MRPRHARYPYLRAARDAVREAGVDLPTVVDEERAVVDRATERVLNAIDGDGVGEPAADARTELLSYPVARVLVSLVDEAVLTRRYARAEARTARTRFEAAIETDGDELRSVQRDRIDLDRLLGEFDLDGAVRDAGEEFAVEVTAYLRLASAVSDDEWRLVNRRLSGGSVPVDRPELYRLLAAAVEQRVAEDLPLSVPDAVAEALAGPAERVRDRLADFDLTREIDTVVPELFPPCMQHLLDRIQAGEHLEHHSRFAITAFLTEIGLSTDEIVDLYKVNPGFGEEVTRYQTDHIRGETGPTQYTPPSCATMQSYGDCVNRDDLCDTISHPLAYYEAKLDDADEEAVEDWRDRDDEAEA